MTGFEIFTLILVIIFVAATVAYQFSKHHRSLKDMIEDVKDIEVKAEEVVNELYNKDLRPAVEEKTTEEADKPKKKRKYYPKKPKTSI
jgi:predicted Holliday junction resolvase-like endonuclease